MQENIREIFDRFLSRLEDVFFWYKDYAKEKDALYYTDSVATVTGYTKDELFSMPGNGKDIVLEDDVKELKTKIEELKNNPQRNSLNLEFRMLRKDNTIIWVNETILVERDEGGKIIKSFGRICNISAHKEKEKLLEKEQDALIKLNASKDNFIAMLSHDLRAPFTSILGFSEILLNEPNLSDTEKEEYLSYINDSSQNQLHLINDLLDWSRLQTGTFKIERQKVHAQSMIFNCVSSLTGNAVRKNIDIKVAVPDTFYLKVDERLITQVILNLLNNAIKFSPEHTTVDVTSNIFNEEFTEFVISDEGVGITEDGKDTLFKIGRIFSTEGTKGEKGTGLGLALTKQIVEKHGGDIWFYSSRGKGSEFHFTVPSSANTILIVKNDKNKRKNYIEVLNTMFPSFRIIEAENGYEALGMIVSHLPSLIITDHEMPLMNGIQLIRALRGGERPLRIPIIALLNIDSDHISQEYSEFDIKTIADDPTELDNMKGELYAILN